MSTGEINNIMKEQYAVIEFEQKVYDAMEYVADAKGILVEQKYQIVDQLRCLSRDTMFGFHIESGAFLRVPSSMSEKQYDNKSNDPIRLAKSLVEQYKAKRKVA